MGELPHFIANVPEQTISKQEESSNPTRILRRFEGSRTGTGIVDVFIVPEGYKFEIRYIQTTCVNGVAPPTINEFQLQTQQPGGANLQSIFFISLDHQEHYSDWISMGESTFFVNSGDLIRMRLGSGGASSIFRVVLFGYLIRNAEISTKLDIV